MHEFSLNKSTEDMDSDELRSTLDEFMQKHEQNVEEYQELETEATEYSEKVESLEETVTEYSETAESLQTKFSEIVAQESSLFDAEEVADRFSLGELIEKADGLGAFSLDSEPTEESEEETKFSEKPERAPVESNGGKNSEFRTQAEADLKGILGSDF